MCYTSSHRGVVREGYLQVFSSAKVRIDGEPVLGPIAMIALWKVDDDRRYPDRVETHPCLVIRLVLQSSPPPQKRSSSKEERSNPWYTGDHWWCPWMFLRNIVEGCCMVECCLGFAQNDQWAADRLSSFSTHRVSPPRQRTRKWNSPTTTTTSL